MKKLNLIWFIALLILPCVLSVQTYAPNEVIPLGIHLSNSSGGVVGANCSAQIRDGSLNVIADIVMQEINGGWYNATYNTSQTGYNYCLQNCTLGTSYTADTCDFIVAEDEIMSWVIIFTIFAIITLYLYLTKNIEFDLFDSTAWTKHKGISFMFTMMTYWLLFIPLGIIIEYNTSAVIEGYLTLFYTIMATMNTFFTVYFFAWLIVNMAKLYKVRQMQKGGYSK